MLGRCSRNYSKFQGKKPKPQSFLNRVDNFQSPNFFKRNSSTIVFPQILPKFSEQFSYTPSLIDCSEDSMERKILSLIFCHLLSFFVIIWWILSLHFSSTLKYLLTSSIQLIQIFFRNNWLLIIITATFYIFNFVATKHMQDSFLLFAELVNFLIVY